MRTSRGSSSRSSIVLPPPPFVSARHHKSNTIGIDIRDIDLDIDNKLSKYKSRQRQRQRQQPLFPSMVSELAFDHDVDFGKTSATNSSSSNEDDGNTTNTNRPMFSLSCMLDGLLCMPSRGDDPDLFFDAEEKPLSREESGMDSNGKLVADNSNTNGSNHSPSPSNNNKKKKKKKKNHSEVLTTTKSNNTTSTTTTKTTALVMSSFSSELGSNDNDNDNDACPSIESVSMSLESIEVELETTSAESSSVLTRTVCQFRGGEQQYHQEQHQQQHQQQLSASMNGYNNDALNRHPSPPPQEGVASHNPFARIQAPAAPKALPLRFLRAGKGDPIEGQCRYEDTLQWRKGFSVDTILLEPHSHFETIKSNYPHYFHLRGRQGEPVFFEQPPRTNLEALRRAGIDLLDLVRHYTMVAEFQWQYIEPNDLARSITVLDLEGIRMMDFVGECVEYVKMCSRISQLHYPERAGHVLVVNVPRW